MNGEAEEIMTAEESGGIEDLTVGSAAEENGVTEARLVMEAGGDAGAGGGADRDAGERRAAEHRGVH